MLKMSKHTIVMVLVGSVVGTHSKLGAWDVATRCSSSSPCLPDRHFCVRSGKGGLTWVIHINCSVDVLLDSAHSAPHSHLGK